MKNACRIILIFIDHISLNLYLLFYDEVNIDENKSLKHLISIIKDFYRKDI